MREGAVESFPACPAHELGYSRRRGERLAGPARAAVAAECGVGMPPVVEQFQRVRQRPRCQLDLVSRCLEALETAAFNLFLYARMLGCAAEIDDHLNRGRDMDTRTAASKCRFVA